MATVGSHLDSILDSHICTLDPCSGNMQVSIFVNDVHYVSCFNILEYLYIGWVHPVAHVTMNDYNNPLFATMFQRALLNTCITTCFGLNPSHHQVLSYTEY
jgi:hypothetical protein